MKGGLGMVPYHDGSRRRSPINGLVRGPDGILRPQVQLPSLGQVARGVGRVLGNGVEVGRQAHSVGRQIYSAASSAIVNRPTKTQPVQTTTSKTPTPTSMYPGEEATAPPDTQDSEARPTLSFNATYNGGKSESGSIGSGSQQDHFYKSTLAYNTDVYPMNIKRRLILPYTIPITEREGNVSRNFISWYSPSASNIYNYLSPEIYDAIAKSIPEYIKIVDIKCTINNAWISSQMQQTANERNVTDRPEIALMLDRNETLPVMDPYEYARGYKDYPFPADEYQQQNPPLLRTHEFYNEGSGSSMLEYYFQVHNAGGVLPINPPILALGKYKVWNGEDSIKIHQPNTPWMPAWRIDREGGDLTRDLYTEYFSLKKFPDSQVYAATQTPHMMEDNTIIDSYYEATDSYSTNQHPTEAWLKLFTPNTNNNYECYIQVTYSCKVLVKRRNSALSTIPITPTKLEHVGYRINFSSQENQWQLLKLRFPQYDRWKNNARLKYANANQSFFTSKFWLDIVGGGEGVHARSSALTLLKEEREKIDEKRKIEVQEELIMAEKNVEEIKKKIKIEVSDE